MTIYCIENIVNGKCYVGQTIQPLKKRLDSHKFHLRNDRHDNPHLQRSWNKHGENNFRFFVLEDGLETLKELNKAEVKWIKELDTTLGKTGYNLQTGGENFNLHESTKDKIRKSISISVIKYSLDGDLLKIYESIDHAAKEYDGSIQNIVTCLKGITNTAYDFQWRYYTDDYKDKIECCESRIEQQRNQGDSKVTEQYDLNGNFIAEYPSAAEASRQTDINSASIRATCKRRYKTGGGYQWKYKGSDKEIENLKDYNPPNNTPKFVIKLNEMGVVVGEWDSIRDASKEVNRSRPYISERCKDKNNVIWNFAT